MLLADYCSNIAGNKSVSGTRQWPEVSDFVKRFCMLSESKHTAMLESHYSCTAMCFFTSTMCKKV